MIDYEIHLDAPCLNYNTALSKAIGQINAGQFNPALVNEIHAGERKQLMDDIMDYVSFFQPTKKAPVGA